MTRPTARKAAPAAWLSCALACVAGTATALALSPSALAAPLPSRPQLQTGRLLWAAQSGAARTWALAAAGNAVPASNLAPPSAMQDACSTGTVGQCDTASLAAINVAHRIEGVGPIVLPRDYEALPVVGQVVIVTNAERRARRLPALKGPEAPFDRLAQQGAAQDQDPTGPAGYTWVSNLAAGFRTALEADYEWMYNDGPSGINVDCPAAGSLGCWAHRQNILAPWPGVVGAAVRAMPDGAKVFAELIVERAP